MSLKNATAIALAYRYLNGESSVQYQTAASRVSLTQLNDHRDTPLDVVIARVREMASENASLNPMLSALQTHESMLAVEANAKANATEAWLAQKQAKVELKKAREVRMAAARKSRSLVKRIRNLLRRHGKMANLSAAKAQALKAQFRELAHTWDERLKAFVSPILAENRELGWIGSVTLIEVMGRNTQGWVPASPDANVLELLRMDSSFEATLGRAHEYAQARVHMSVNGVDTTRRLSEIVWERWALATGEIESKVDATIAEVSAKIGELAPLV